MNNTMYMAYDGDNCGRKVGQAILADDPNALHEISARINLGHDIVRKWVEENGGQIISGGGDEGCFSIGSNALENIEELRKDYEFATNITMTVGVGSTLSEAGKSLLVGKFRGKNQVVQYDPNIDSEIKQAQINLEQGTASPEEKKLGEAYLKPNGGTAAVSTDVNDPNFKGVIDNDPYQDSKTANAFDTSAHVEDSHADCPYCQEESVAHNPNSPDHAADCPYCQAVSQHDSSTCPYCQEADAAIHDPSEDGHPADCPYCAESAARDSHNPSEEGHPADCPYCQEESFTNDAGGDDQTITPSGPDTLNPTTQSSQNFSGQDLLAPDMPKPPPISEFPPTVAPDSDVQTNNNIVLQAEQGEPNEEIVEEIPQASAQAGPVGDSASQETVQDIVGQIDQAPGDTSQEDKAALKNADDANIPEGSAMEENVSTPEGFRHNTPDDLGMERDDLSQANDTMNQDGEPDMNSVLQEGLESNANDAQLDQVVQLVASSLADFKQCKDFIEASRQQAPQLYSSSISMLKAMIEMAKLLGLDQQVEQAESSPEIGGQLNGESGNPAEAMNGNDTQASAPREKPKSGNPAHAMDGGDPKYLRQ